MQWLTRHVLVRTFTNDEIDESNERGSKLTVAGKPAGRICTSKFSEAAQLIHASRTLLHERKRDRRSARLHPKIHQVRVQAVPWHPVGMDQSKRRFVGSSF